MGSLWASVRNMLSRLLIHPVEDGSSDLRGYPGKLLELQAGRKVSFNFHNWWVRRFPTFISPIHVPKAPVSRARQQEALGAGWLPDRGRGVGRRNINSK